MTVATPAIACTLEGGAHPSPKTCGGCPSTTTDVAQEPAQDAASGHGQAVKKGRATAAAMATAALACGVCCVVSIALPGVAVGGFGAALAWLGGAHAAVTAIAAVFVVGGWLLVLRDASRRKGRPAAATLWLMGIASLVLATAMAWPRLESAVVNLLAAT